MYYSTLIQHVAHKGLGVLYCLLRTALGLPSVSPMTMEDQNCPMSDFKISFNLTPCAAEMQLKFSKPAPRFLEGEYPITTAQQLISFKLNARYPSAQDLFSASPKNGSLAQSSRGGSWLKQRMCRSASERPYPRSAFLRR